ncbi:hypothetical protein [Rubrivirga sp. IMCC43871]|uniref:hypothetical protein n=1 Tax=Rubrivirga sp. IMCC43871 TaxID=3391575 RepID=UPI00398FADE7
MTTRIALFALALTLPLAACESEPEVADTDPMIVETDDAMMEDDMMADDDLMAAPEVTPEGTVQAVTDAGGLLSLAVPAAISNIDGWIAQLSGNADFAPVVADLETLRGQLQADPIDGAAVGATLQSLGAATTGAAGDNASLQTLGEALTAGGNELTGM